MWYKEIIMKSIRVSVIILIYNDILLNQKNKYTKIVRNFDYEICWQKNFLNIDSLFYI